MNVAQTSWMDRRALRLFVCPVSVLLHSFCCTINYFYFSLYFRGDRDNDNYKTKSYRSSLQQQLFMLSKQTLLVLSMFYLTNTSLIEINCRLSIGLLVINHSNLQMVAQQYSLWGNQLSGSTSEANHSRNGLADVCRQIVHLQNSNISVVLCRKILRSYK